VASGAAPLCAASDVDSFGVLAWGLAMGTPAPFPFDPIAVIAHTVAGGRLALGAEDVTAVRQNAVVVEIVHAYTAGGESARNPRAGAGW
jgi:hypothetical protein